MPAEATRAIRRRFRLIPSRQQTIVLTTKNIEIMTQITYYAYTKYDLALMFTLLTLIDARLAELETEA